MGFLYNRGDLYNGSTLAQTESDVAHLSLYLCNIHSFAYHVAVSLSALLPCMVYMHCSTFSNKIYISPDKQPSFYGSLSPTTLLVHSEFFSILYALGQTYISHLNWTRQDRQTYMRTLKSHTYTCTYTQAHMYAHMYTPTHTHTHTHARTHPTYSA